MTALIGKYPEHFNANARLAILKALAEQNDYRLNDSVLLEILDTFAMNRGRAYLVNQLNWLSHTAGAVVLVEAGTAVIAEITDAGLDHVERRIVLDGVKRPSPKRGS